MSFRSDKREFVSWITKSGRRSRWHVMRTDRYPFTLCGEHVMGLKQVTVTSVLPETNRCLNGGVLAGGCRGWFMDHVK
jgi:hypothetical protein